MKNRKKYWQKYYNDKVKPDKKKMAKRSINAVRFKDNWIKLPGSLYRKLQKEAHRRNIKVNNVAEEVIREAYK